MYNWHDGNKKNLRTIEAQIVQKLKNNEARPKFTGSNKKKSVQFNFWCVVTTDWRIGNKSVVHQNLGPLNREGMGR